MRSRCLYLRNILADIQAGGLSSLCGDAQLKVSSVMTVSDNTSPVSEQPTQHAIDQAYAAGINAGRQALLSELAQLEGVPIDAAIEVAQLTRLAVLYIVRPIAQLLATL